MTFSNCNVCLLKSMFLEELRGNGYKDAVYLGLMQTAAAPCTTRGTAGRGVYNCARPHSPGPPKSDLCRANRAGQEFFASRQ